MKKLIYINLFIDNDWDTEKIIDQIFSIKIESSKNILKSYSHFGLFFGAGSDEVLIESPIDNDFRYYLESHFGSLALPIIVENYLAQPNSGIDLILSGVSKKEEKIFGSLIKSKSLLSADKFCRLNRKDYILELRNKIDFNLPASQKILLKNILQSPITKPFCIKFLNSSGGGGVFKVTHGGNILDFLATQLEDFLESLVVLKQDLIEVKSHFYTVAHTDILNEPIGFEINYDSKGNSTRHRLLKSIPVERIKLARDVASELSKEGYSGSFGFDGFIDLNGNEYPLIDLNVRIDKSRIFHKVIERFNRPKADLEIRRERISLKAYASFKDFQIDKLEKIQAVNVQFDNQFSLVIILCSNLFHSNNDQTVGELTFLLINEGQNNNKDYDHWIRKCYEVLGVDNNEK